MKGVIVAAGLSSRLYPLTKDTPKSLLDVGGRSMIERALDAFEAHGITDTVIVTGFRRDRLHEVVRDRARFVHNPFYKETNNAGSLWLALPHAWEDDVVYAHADVVYDEGVLTRLLKAEPSGGIDLLVDYGSVDEEAMKVRTRDGRFVESSKAIPLDEAAGEWTGLARISRQAAPALHARIATLLDDPASRQEYDTRAFNALAADGMPFGLVSTDGLPWNEVDTREDLEHARALFAHGGTRA